jgi:hypothetical protein
VNAAVRPAWWSGGASPAPDVEPVDAPEVRDVVGDEWECMDERDRGDEDVCVTDQAARAMGRSLDLSCPIDCLVGERQDLARAAALVEYLDLAKGLLCPQTAHKVR